MMLAELLDVMSEDPELKKIKIFMVPWFFFLTLATPGGGATLAPTAGFLTAVPKPLWVSV